MLKTYRHLFLHVINRRYHNQFIVIILSIHVEIRYFIGWDFEPFGIYMVFNGREKGREKKEIGLVVCEVEVFV